jgi:hypothetical protein
MLSFGSDPNRNSEPKHLVFGPEGLELVGNDREMVNGKKWMKQVEKHDPATKTAVVAAGLGMKAASTPASSWRWWFAGIADEG